MSSLPDSVQPRWQENGTNSPETLPPGFENPSPLLTPTTPLLENTACSLPCSTSPLPQDNQDDLTHRPPPPSPITLPPEKIQSYLPPLNPPRENCSPSLQTVQLPPQEIEVSLSPPFPPNEKEIHDTVPCSAQQTLECQDPLLLPQLPQGNSSSPLPPPLQSLPEMGQMICGNCNQLLSYPIGSKYIQCACCQTTNFVLEAHQVGIVNCGKCFILLMYPYTAKSLRCSSCHYVTEIGHHNLRPPVSVLQGFPAAPQKGLADLRC